VRNVYALYNYGDFVDGLRNKTADPFIQFLPITSDTTEAHSDFISVRGNPPSSNSSSFHLGTSAIVGIICAAVFVLASLVTFFVHRHQKRKAFGTIRHTAKPSNIEAGQETHYIRFDGTQTEKVILPTLPSAWVKQ
jgi:hypothetical protein